MKGRYDELTKQGQPKTLAAFAKKHGLGQAEVENAAQVLRNINSNLDTGPNIDEDFHKKYKRVKVGKLLVPRSFHEHCLLICDLMGIREEAFWQMIMMEAMALYADKAGAVVELTNKVISKERGSGESDTDNQPQPDSQS